MRCMRIVHLFDEEAEEEERRYICACVCVWGDVSAFIWSEMIDSLHSDHLVWIDTKIFTCRATSTIVNRFLFFFVVVVVQVPLKETGETKFQQIFVWSSFYYTNTNAFFYVARMPNAQLLGQTKTTRMNRRTQSKNMNLCKCVCVYVPDQCVRA